jgi:hypothetical protein
LNVFTIEKEVFINKKYKEHIAALRIQQNWFKARLNPEYMLCKKQVDEFYERVFESHYNKM